MPRGDGTGPAGQGPMTGRGMGRCGTGANQTPSSGWGRGLGQRISNGFNNLFNRRPRGQGGGGGMGRRSGR